MTGDVVGRWKESVKDFVSPTNISFTEKAESGESEVGSPGAEVTEVVEKLHGGMFPGLDEICPELFKEVVGLSWLTRPLGTVTSGLANWGGGSPF